LPAPPLPLIREGGDREFEVVRTGTEPFVSLEGTKTLPLPPRPDECCTYVLDRLQLATGCGLTG
jgi:hypothetical protein